MDFNENENDGALWPVQRSAGDHGGAADEFTDVAEILQKRMKEREMTDNTVLESAGVVIQSAGAEWVDMELGALMTPEVASVENVQMNIPTSSERSEFIAWSSESCASSSSGGSSDGLPTPISSGSLYSPTTLTKIAPFSPMRSPKVVSPATSPKPTTQQPRRTQTYPYRPQPNTPHTIPSLFRSGSSRRRFSTIPRPLTLKGLAFADDDHDALDGGIVNVNIGLHRSPVPKKVLVLSAAAVPVSGHGADGNTGEGRKENWDTKVYIVVTPPTPSTVVSPLPLAYEDTTAYLHPSSAIEPIDTLGYDIYDSLVYDEEEEEEEVPLYENNIVYRPSSSNNNRSQRGRQPAFPARPISRMITMISSPPAQRQRVGEVGLKSAWSSSSDDQTPSSSSSSGFPSCSSSASARPTTNPNNTKSMMTSPMSAPTTAPSSASPSPHSPPVMHLVSKPIALTYQFARYADLAGGSERGGGGGAGKSAPANSMRSEDVELETVESSGLFSVGSSAGLVQSATVDSGKKRRSTTTTTTRPSPHTAGGRSGFVPPTEWLSFGSAGIRTRTRTGTTRKNHIEDAENVPPLDTNPSSPRTRPRPSLRVNVTHASPTILNTSPPTFAPSSSLDTNDSGDQSKTNTNTKKSHRSISIHSSASLSLLEVHVPSSPLSPSYSSSSSNNANVGAGVGTGIGGEGNCSAREVFALASPPPPTTRHSGVSGVSGVPSVPPLPSFTAAAVGMLPASTTTDVESSEHPFKMAAASASLVRKFASRRRKRVSNENGVGRKGKGTKEEEE